MHDAATVIEKATRKSVEYRWMAAAKERPTAHTVTAAARSARTSPVSVRRRLPCANTSWANETAAANVTLVTVVSTARKAVHAMRVMSTTRPVEPSWSTPAANRIGDDCPPASTAPIPNAPTTAADAKPVVIRRRMNSRPGWRSWPVVLLSGRRPVPAGDLSGDNDGDSFRRQKRSQCPKTTRRGNLGVGGAVRAGFAGRVRLVPHWEPGLGADVLPQSYRDVVEVLADAVYPMRAHHLCAALRLSTDKSRVESFSRMSPSIR